MRKNIEQPKEKKETGSCDNLKAAFGESDIARSDERDGDKDERHREKTEEDGQNSVEDDHGDGNEIKYGNESH